MFTYLRRDKTSPAAEIGSRVRRFSRNCISILAMALAVGALQQARAGVGDRVRIGQAGDWKNTIAVAVKNDRLYTVEKSGTLYVTDLSSGRWSSVGQAVFAGTRFMFAAGQNLYMIMADGSLYRVNPLNGAYSRLGQPGQWKDTIAGTALNGQLYTIERSGGLYQTSIQSGTWRQVGKPDFAGARLMVGAFQALYTIENNGIFFVNPANGSWEMLGKAANWSGTRAAAIVGTYLYSANQNGKLYVSHLTNGQLAVIGQPVFGSTAYMFENRNRLYAIDADGSLYYIETSRSAG